MLKYSGNVKAEQTLLSVFCHRMLLGTKMSNYKDEWNCSSTVDVNSAVLSGSGTVSTSQVMVSHC